MDNAAQMHVVAATFPGRSCARRLRRNSGLDQIAVTSLLRSKALRTAPPAFPLSLPRRKRPLRRSPHRAPAPPAPRPCPERPFLLPDRLLSLRLRLADSRAMLRAQIPQPP